MRQHGGTIEMASELERGTRVTVWLPLTSHYSGEAEPTPDDTSSGEEVAT